MNNLLRTEEKALLRKLGLATVLLAAAGLVLFIRIRGHCAGLKAGIFEVAERIAATERQASDAGREFGAWDQAARDIAEVRSGRLFPKASAGQDIRLELQRILDAAGARIGEVNFAYGDPGDKDRLGKISVTFVYSGSYEGLKRLLAVVEAEPKFLVIEKLDFMDTGGRSSEMKIKFTVAGYYEI